MATSEATVANLDDDPTADSIMVRTTGLEKTYQAGSTRIHACRQVDISVKRGEVVAVTGPSGSGKSTLLHLIGALDTPDAGTIIVGEQAVTELRGRKLAAYRRTVGFVFQRFHLLPTLTAADNVLAPVLPYRVAFDKRAKARRILAAVGLAGRETALPSKLSGGQQQRVAIARALVNDPLLILADEPTGSLDSATGLEIIDLLFGLRERLNTTLLVATHDAELAARCDRVIRLLDGGLVAP